ncbi:hypothetical protein VNO77_19099 [Canavalia gladiata]|uniref:TPX2 C-terminal domain-containing protein n=1 Tax=Canavalia gladiata TaxID=3824 RepID=A0AAN9LQR6_CANGL
MSESLAWEKWSTFSHNRYVEEAERFTQPGSVAQKKAFFEAHYKKLAAEREAALLEQANSASQAQQEHEAVVDNINTQNSQMTSPKSKLVDHEENADLNMETSLPESNKAEGAKLKTDHQAFQDVDKHRELSEKVSGTPEMETPKLKDILQSRGKKKSPVSPFKLLQVIGTSKFNSTPVKSNASILSNGDDIATPMSNKPALNSAGEERSTARSLHKSHNFTFIKEINRLTTSVMRIFESSRVGASSSKTSKDSSTPLRTTTKVCQNELQNHSSFTPLTEAKRSKRPSPIISSYPLRTEERVSSRKKKLEKASNASEEQNVKLQTKFKEKAEIKIRKLREGFCFKARSPPDFYKEKEAPKRETKQDPLTLPELPKERRRLISVVERKSSLPPPRRPFQGKNCGTLTLSLTSNSQMITTHENTSPNIQHGIRIT